MDAKKITSAGIVWDILHTSVSSTLVFYMFGLWTGIDRSKCLTKFHTLQAIEVYGIFYYYSAAKSKLVAIH